VPIYVDASKADMFIIGDSLRYHDKKTSEWDIRTDPSPSTRSKAWDGTW